MKKICYCCITSNYDLPKPFTRAEKWEYIMFTNIDIPVEKHVGWKVIEIENDLGLSNVKLSRYYKHNPHLVLPNYDVCAWIDGNIYIVADLNYILRCLPKKFDLVSMNHPHRNCIYKEAEVCIQENKDSAEIIKKQMNKYKTEGFPENQGMIQSGILFRTKADKVINFSEQWWKEVEKGSCRDQLSFNYVKWKNTNSLKHTIINFNVLFNKNLFPINAHQHGW